MKVGFTGTRLGMTPVQLTKFREVVMQVELTEFHHGNAIGADAEAARIVYEMEWDDGDDRWTRVVAHTCSRRGQQVDPPIGDEVLPPRQPLDRNRDIVDACRLLIACPASAKEEWRSGTWATVRYARHKGKRIIIIQPDGSVVEENRQ